MLAPTDAPPLEPWHLARIAAASRDLAKVRRCERIAGLSGTTTLLAGLASLPFVLGSGVGMALCVALVVLGWRERSFRAGLRAIEPLVCRRLAGNQAALGVALTAYGAINLVRGPASAADLTGGQLASSPELAAAAEGVVRLAHAGLYGGLVIVALVVQGAQAAYYARVGRAMRRAYANHPMWVMRIHRAAWSGVSTPGTAEVEAPGPAPLSAAA